MPQSPQFTAAEDRERYLAQISMRLSKHASPIQAAEQVDEIRHHLDSIAKAYEEMGLDSAAAMTAAMSKFGAAGELGAQLAAKAKPSLRPSLFDALRGKYPLRPIAGYALVVSTMALAGFGYWSLSGLLLWHPFRPTLLSLVALLSSALNLSLLVCSFCWVVRRPKPLTVGLFCAGLINANLARGFYPQAIAEHAIGLMILTGLQSSALWFAFGYGASVLTKRIQANTLSKNSQQGPRVAG